MKNSVSENPSMGITTFYEITTFYDWLYVGWFGETLSLVRRTSSQLSMPEIKSTAKASRATTEFAKLSHLGQSFDW
jgi:hypothetical protein